ncbi:MAG: Mrp/NBP35 family ATP-binding protein [Acidilobaceae archaeon]
MAEETGGKRLRIRGEPGEPSYKQVAEHMRRYAEMRRAAARNLEKVKHVVVVTSTKGGVGKSMVTVNLAAALALRGLKVGVFDIDFHGPSVHKLLGLPTGMGLPVTVDGSIVPVTVQPLGIKVVSIGLLLKSDDEAVVWRGPIKASAVNELLSYIDWGDLDMLLVDTPPGTGDEVLSLLQLLPRKISGIVLVATPSEITRVVARKTATLARQLRAPLLGVVENMSYFRCRSGEIVYVFGESRGEAFARELSTRFLGAIPLDPELRRLGDQGVPVVLAAPESESARAFASIAEKLLQALEEEEKSREVGEEPSEEGER